MGDIIELTIWPKHVNKTFYKITSSALLFELKGHGNAAIGLSRKPTNVCDYLIVIGERQCCWIQKAGCRHKEIQTTPEILSMEEYRSFWLTWSLGQVRLGREGDSTAIVSYSNSIRDLKYVTFSVLEERNPLHWRFELPPVSQPVTYNDITGSELHWVPYDNSEVLPEEPLVGGHEKEQVYIARAKHRGSLTPGKFVASKSKAFIPWGGEANEKLEFEVLCGFDGLWVPTCDDKIPVGAFEAGYSEVALERLYVGRAWHEGHLIPGKVAPSHKVCYIAYEGKEVAVKNYEILVLPRENERSANKIYIPDEVAEEPDINEFEFQYSDSNDTDEEHVFVSIECQLETA